MPSTSSSLRKKWRPSSSPCPTGRVVSPVCSHLTHSMAPYADMPSSTKNVNISSVSVVQWNLSLAAGSGGAPGSRCATDPTKGVGSSSLLPSVYPSLRSSSGTGYPAVRRDTTRCFQRLGRKLEDLGLRKQVSVLWDLARSVSPVALQKAHPRASRGAPPREPLG